MTNVTNEELIGKARSVVHPTRFGQCDVGGVGCALVAEGGNIHLGVCIDACCGIGFCAEHGAIAAMVTGGESRIVKIVAVFEGKVIPPCGRCRELMYQLNPANAETEVLLGAKKIVTLKELLPFPCY